jgi:hypothetical protein
VLTFVRTEVHNKSSCADGRIIIKRVVHGYSVGMLTVPTGHSPAVYVECCFAGAVMTFSVAYCGKSTVWAFPPLLLLPVRVVMYFIAS